MNENQVPCRVVKSILFLILLSSSVVFAGLQAPDFLKALQSQILQDPEFNKTYIKSGCQVRAHWISILLHDLGYAPLKVFALSKALGKMEVTLASGQSTSWVFHVAAGFQEKDGQIWILDPVFSDRPQRLEDWKQVFFKHNSPDLILFQQTGPEVYHLMDSGTQNDFETMGSPYSEKARAFIKDAMEDLFIWEKWDLKNNLVEGFKG